MPWTKKQKGLWGAAYGNKKKGKGKPSYVPTSMWNQSMGKLKEYLKEPTKKSKGKKKRKKK